MNKCMRIIIAFVMVSFIAGCDSIQNLPFFKGKETSKSIYAPPPAGAIVVAKVGKFYITKTDLDKEIEMLNSALEEKGAGENKINTAEKKILYLKNEIVPRYLFYQEALDRRLNEDPEMEKILRATDISLLVSKLKSELLGKLSVSDAEIDDFYNKNKNNREYRGFFYSSEKRRILEIAVNSKSDANQANIQLLNGTSFAEVAKQVSTDTKSKDKGGDLGYVSLEADPKDRIMFDKFYEIAFSPNLEKGDTSSVFSGPDGKFYIVRIEDIKKSEPKSRSELSDSIKDYLMYDKQKKALDEVMQKIKSQSPVEVFEGKVE